MLEMTLALVVIGLLIVWPMAWRVARDRQEERALALRAIVQSVINRKLGGESLVAVDVRPHTLWRRGRVRLSVPEGWEWLVDPLWTSVLGHVPAEYELIVPGRGPEVPIPDAALRPAA